MKMTSSVPAGQLLFAENGYTSVPADILISNRSMCIYVFVDWRSLFCY